MSLVKCLQEAGALVPGGDSAAILARAAELRRQGLSADDAGRQAIRERVVAVRTELGDAAGTEGTQYAIGGLPIVEAPVKDITLSRDVPQFKSDANEAGVVEPLGGKFERTGVAPIQLWRRLDGRLEVISGRHRLDLARRSGERTIPAQVHEEAAGFDTRRASALDAELNIRDGQGKVRDYVDYFQATGITRAEADSRGLLARAIGRRAYGIASDGSADLVAAHRAGHLGDEAAATIAGAAPGDGALQAVGIKAVQGGQSIAQAANTMRAVALMRGERGESSGDLFGFDDAAMRDAEQMAKIATAEQRSLGERINAITGAAKRPDLAKAEGVNVKDAKAVQARAEALRQERAAWDNWSTNPELVEQIRARMTGGEPKRTDAAIEKALAAKIKRDFDGAAKEYAALEESQGGKVLNTETARELSPDYLADRTRSAAVHEPASKFIKDLYTQKLAEAPKDGELPMVLFTAGGTGAGKSSAIKLLPKMQRYADEAQIIYDTNMNGYASSKQKVEQALKAGKDVTIVMVARDPEDALVGGALPRAERQRAEFGSGRTVPLKEHIRTHVGALETMNKLAAEYAGDARVSISVVDNSLGRGKAVERPLDWLASLKYNDVERRVSAALERERAKGTISDATYQGFAGKPAGSQPGGGEAPRRIPQGDRPGDGVGSEQEPGARQEVAAGDEAAGNDARLAAAARQFPDLQVMIDGMERPLALQEFLAAAKAEADELAADAPLMQVAAECALLNLT